MGDSTYMDLDKYISSFSTAKHLILSDKSFASHNTAYFFDIITVIKGTFLISGKFQLEADFHASNLLNDCLKKQHVQLDLV